MSGKCSKRKVRLEADPKPYQSPCRYEISQHPEVERKILEELTTLGLQAGGDASKVLTYADLGQLAYLDATIKVDPDL